MKEKLKENRHNIYKSLIALVFIPVVTSLITRHLHLVDMTRFTYIAIVIGISYISTTIYDWVVLKEPKRTLEQIAENSLDIRLIKEDVRELQRVVHKDEKEEIRRMNAERARRREQGLLDARDLYDERG